MIHGKFREMSVEGFVGYRVSAVVYASWWLTDVLVDNLLIFCGAWQRLHCHGCIWMSRAWFFWRSAEHSSIVCTTLGVSLKPYRSKCLLTTRGRPVQHPRRHSCHIQWKISEWSAHGHYVFRAASVTSFQLHPSHKSANYPPSIFRSIMYGLDMIQTKYHQKISGYQCIILVICMEHLRRHLTQIPEIFNGWFCWSRCHPWIHLQPSTLVHMNCYSSLPHKIHARTGKDSQRIFKETEYPRSFWPNPLYFQWLPTYRWSGLQVPRNKNPCEKKVSYSASDHLPNVLVCSVSLLSKERPIGARHHACVWKIGSVDCGFLFWFVLWLCLIQVLEGLLLYTIEEKVKTTSSLNANAC